MHHHSATPKAMCQALWQHRELLIASTVREVLGRYRGSTFGLLWSIFNPVFLLSVYTFVFSVVFRSRWSGGGGSKTEFALVLFAGLIFFNMLSDCLSRAPTVITSNVNYVKKVIFPLEILPVIVVFSAAFHALISMGVWFLAYFLFVGPPSLNVIYLPVLVLSLLWISMGVSWILSSLGVYLRDVGQVVGIFTTVLMFLSPIFYPVSALPELYRNILYVNPLTYIIEQARIVMYYGGGVDYLLLIFGAAGSLGFAWFGFFAFQKMRPGFADVL